MADILAVTQLGDPVLRDHAQPVANIWEPRIQSLIDDLMATVIEKNGVGIAAPQVGYSDRILVIASRPSIRYPAAPEMEPTAMINPKIIGKSDEMVADWEGCLSVPGIRGIVNRYQAIEVEYTSRDGHLEHRELTGFVARIFQHEYDHLEGIIFLDRVADSHSMMTEDEYQKRIVFQS
ncbi:MULTISPECIES: peptide deformylase [Arthrospira]|uniref:peptide deformylase n=1 Tax=Oscillatoriales TaxID=1150 RepID=UPI0001C38899|nr:peptide deformylase [Arthrospira platensis]AMW27114.1 peptide deformylase [Arthrospira platensis YZ]KDR55386.1 peptide deformylase [Arthrospira platensis str. Paraca]MBD2670323.1 peptide deformylase [Arthrospira platensis FACHB-439]MBD2710937.1 peptide deformylase [Arthrospira platensis FACHB-835]MDF2211414.1 peptide deformylase [Arthrospira platensis NCB002]MDT9183431.1 peptide deformylase [Limnospira sp. PMC 289.06]MDT9295489.1 peptide deformylase [Arthrospira platensis PCC 7345]MDT931